MIEDSGHRHTQLQPRRLLAALIALALAMPIGATAQDAMSDRYQDIRAPTEALLHRMARQRLQADLNGLGREQIRVDGRRRVADRLRVLDPESGFAAAERALEARLDRIRIDQRDTAARLADLAREPTALPTSALPTLRGADIAGPALDAAGIDPVSTEEAVAAARAYVDGLLRANRARP